MLRNQSKLPSLSQKWIVEQNIRYAGDETFTAGLDSSQVDTSLYC